MEEKELYRIYKKKRRVILAVSILILIFLYAFKNAFFLVRTLSAISLLFVFYIVDHLFDVNFERRHYFFIVIIAVSSFVLSPFYTTYANYDKIQHLIMPMMYGSILFHMVKRLDLKLKWKLVFVFFIIAGSVALLEIGEYLLDYFFDFKLQGVFIRDLTSFQAYGLLLDRLDDTMIDMSLSVISALVYTISLGIYERKWKGIA